MFEFSNNLAIMLLLFYTTKRVGYSFIQHAAPIVHMNILGRLNIPLTAPIISFAPEQMLAS